MLSLYGYEPPGKNYGCKERPAQATDRRIANGRKIRPWEYRQLMKQITFELGAIAKHCMDVYLQEPDAYDDYVPLSMLSASNDFYNFMLDSWAVFNKSDDTTLKAAWAMYKTYCEDAKVGYPYTQRAFKEELKNYFREYSEREILSDGTRVRSYYRGFRKEKFEEGSGKKKGYSAPKAGTRFESTAKPFRPGICLLPGAICQ